MMNQSDIDCFRGRVRTNLAGLFAMLDVNSDGFIEKGEVRAMIEYNGFECFPRGLYEGSETWDKEKQIYEFFRMCNKKGDGQITKDELREFFLDTCDKLERKLNGD